MRPGRNLGNLESHTYWDCSKSKETNVGTGVGKGQVGPSYHPGGNLAPSGGLQSGMYPGPEQAMGNSGWYGRESHGKHEETLLGACLLGSQKMAKCRREVTVREKKGIFQLFLGNPGRLCKPFLLKAVKRGGLCPRLKF